MDALTPVLINFLEEHARPHVQEKVTEELGETKVDLKKDLPDTIMDYIKGDEGFPMIANIISNMGDDFMDKIRSVTDMTIETASEGMDLLLTNGVMNISKDVLTSKTDGEGSSGFNFDFLKSGKEGMVMTTMAASAPVIKQVSDNMGRKISAHFPAQIGGAIQEMIDEHGGADGLLGKAAGFVAKFLISDDDGPGEQTVAAGGTDRDIEAVGGHKGTIQSMLQKFLAPKVMLMIQPYLQRFEEKMTSSLEGELRGKVFNIEYIKATALTALTGMAALSAQGGGFGGLIGSFLGGGGRGGDGDDDDNDGQKGGGNDTMSTLTNLAGQFMKNREN
ncbi:hypothetical protein BGX29_007219 [Mortierella sp. GBA35]|nr:hypothetical protein BGX23_010344 [Mortierella sp. AD031]KAF9107158.1 hypothetical protein BGX29_007219 [Mortierella sp. GBA35]KAG0220347.1 hypothetical protein BGX33_000022 [Mortierella sp. NVP41]